MKWEEEYSEEFDELRKNRVKTSYYKYGSVKVNFGEKLVEAIPTAEGCIEKYRHRRETPNTSAMRRITLCLNSCTRRKPAPSFGRQVAARAPES